MSFRTKLETLSSIQGRDAYLALFTHCLPEAVVKKIGSQVADDAGRQLISALFDGIFKNDEKEIKKLTAELAK
jgi:hypothetical protein